MPRSPLVAVSAFAAASAFAVLAGCAVIVVPDDGSGHSHFSFGGNAVQGNGQHASETRQVGSLDALDINGAVQVEVRVGQAPALTVEGDSNLLPLLHTEASGGTLRIWEDGNLRSATPLRVVYSTPELHQVYANGSGQLTISELRGGPLTLAHNGSRMVQLSGRVSRLDLRLNGSGSVYATGLEAGTTVASLNGSGRLDLGRINGEALNLDVHGSGGVSASGAVRSMNVRVHGSGSADLASLTSQSAELSSHGSGGITAAVTQSLVAEANGSGQVTVYGNPAQRSVSGRRVSILQ